MYILSCDWRQMLPRTPALALAALTALALSAMPGQAAASTSTHRQAATPGRHASRFGLPAVPGVPASSGAAGYLNAIGGGARSAWAAGWYQRPRGGSAPLFDRLSGSSWRAVRGKRVGEFDIIEGVSARSVKDAWAVGVYQAAGTHNYRTLTEHWNGARWEHVPSPNPGRFGKGRTFPPSSYLYGVADIGPHDAWAVGSWDQPVLPFSENTNAILLHFNGTSWRKVTAPDPLGLPHDYALDAIVARSPHDIWIAGGYPTSGVTGKLLIEHYNGHRWRIVRAPSPGLSANIASLSLGSKGTVWAAGSYTVPDKTGTTVSKKTLILRWNGSRWKPVPSPDPSARFNVLTGISASANGGAWAVGGYNPHPSAGPSVPDRTLTLRWTRGRWHVVASPNPGRMGSYLYGVLDIASRPVAVGEADSGKQPNLTVRPLMIGWNGRKWRQIKVPVPGR